MIVFRQVDQRFPFLWESAAQPAGRWHGEGEGPAHYFSDTPDGAWAELLRHEEITDPADLPTIARAMWAVDIGEAAPTPVGLADATLLGGPDTWPRCQEHARDLRAAGAARIAAPTAALEAGAAHGWRVADGQRPAPPRDGRVIVVFGAPAPFVGWRVVDRGSPPADLLPHVRHYRRPR